MLVLGDVIYIVKSNPSIEVIHCPTSGPKVVLVIDYKSLAAVVPGLQLNGPLLVCGDYAAFGQTLFLASDYFYVNVYAISIVKLQLQLQSNPLTSISIGQF
jgi:hypothetical protein